MTPKLAWFVFKQRVRAVYDFPAELIGQVLEARVWHNQNVPKSIRTFKATIAFYRAVVSSELMKFRAEWNMHKILMAREALLARLELVIRDAEAEEREAKASSAK